MQLHELIKQENIACDVDAQSKKRALEAVSSLISSHNGSINANEIFDSLIAREKLGATGLGYGVAIPHGRLKNIDTIVAAFIKLKDAIDYDSIDKKPVDLIFALLVPEDAADEHLQTLAMLAKMFNDENIRDSLRKATSADDIIKQLANWEMTQH